jgi:hypothetical protein
LGAIPSGGFVRFLTTAACFVLLGTIAARIEDRSEQSPANQQQVQEQKTSVAGATESQSKIDPAKEADIRALLAVSGTEDMVTQVLGTMTEKSIKPMLTNSLPPGEYREKLINLFLLKLQSKMDARRLLELAVPVYDKYLSDQDVKDLTSFYRTPLGQKTLTVVPKMTAEMQEQGRKMGEQAGRQSMIEVLAEHPELQQALEEAARKARGQ